MAWIRANLTTDGVVTTTDTWLIHRLCGAFVTDVSTASRSLLLDLDSATWDDELLDLFGLAGEELPEIVGLRPDRRRDNDAFGPTHSRRRADRRPAGRAARRELPGSRATRSAPSAPARSCSRSSARNAARSDVGPDHLGGVATARPHRRTARRPGLHRGLGGALGRRPRSGARRRPVRRGRRRPIPATACCACPRWPAWPRRGGTPQADRLVHRDDAEQRTGTSGAGAAGGHRRAGRLPRRPGGARISGSR